MYTIAIAFILASAQFVFSNELVSERQGYIKICSCPNSMHYGCKDFRFDECTPHYLDFDESKEVRYLKPVYVDHGMGYDVFTYAYIDKDCTIPSIFILNPDLQPIGWWCSTEQCWNEAFNMRSGGCYFDTPAEYKGSVTIQGCPGNTKGSKNYNIDQCTPHYTDFDESKGLMVYFKPVFSDRDGDGVTSVTTYAYSDKYCTDLDFIVEGKCNEQCWSETLNLGTTGCDLSSAPFKSALAISIPVFILAMILF